MGEKFNAAIKQMLMAAFDEVSESDDHATRLEIARQIAPPGYVVIAEFREPGDAQDPGTHPGCVAAAANNSSR